MPKLSRVAIVAGEESGDILGAGLIEALRRQFPDCVFEGVGGPRMISEGFVSHFPLERLAVMGLVEPLKRLPELLSIRKNLRKRYSVNPPDIFIGIDAPDFNLSLEASLKKRGIKTAHYVSPSVWAWRQGRVKKIAKAVDLMLTLFPFEAAFYREHAVKVHCVGHPLADKIPTDDCKDDARRHLQLDSQGLYLALLPGSRRSEVEKLCRVFLLASQLCVNEFSELKVLIAGANADRMLEIQAFLTEFPNIPVQLIEGDSHKVMAASDVVLMASGTTTLEALLLKRPMVIAYKMASLSFWIIKRLVKSKYIGLPNLLANKSLVPEFIQDEATPAALAHAVLEFIKLPERTENLTQEYLEIHRSLKKNANYEAAKAVISLWND